MISETPIEKHSFIQKIAGLIKARNYSMEDLHIIVPSDRAANQLRVEIARLFSKPIFAPKIETIDKWMKPENLVVVDETRQLLSLYEISKHMPNIPNANFEEFLSWGKIILSDFNEIDRYLLDPRAVFKNLASIKELESWQIDEEDYSESQKKFLCFWDALPKLYDLFHKALRSKGQLNSGRAYKLFAEAQHDFLSTDAETQFIFAGFNALSKAELFIIKRILDAKKGSFLSDSDELYLHDSLHEAGSFLRKNHELLAVEYLPKPLNQLLKKNLDATFIECAQQIGQVKVAANELSKLSIQELNKTTQANYQIFNNYRITDFSHPICYWG